MNDQSAAPSTSAATGSSPDSDADRTAPEDRLVTTLHSLALEDGPLNYTAVSYTHLTLPTILRV